MQKDESCSEDAIAARAAALLDKWSALKEVYRIPKKASKLVRIKLHGGNSGVWCYFWLLRLSVYVCEGGSGGKDAHSSEQRMSIIDAQLRER